MFALASGGAWAATATVSATFGAKDRSVWTGGKAFTLDTGPKFAGVDWNVGKTVGGIKEVCVFACAKFGAELGADTNGRFGFDYRVTANSGSFDLRYPVQSTLTIPDIVPSGPTIGPITLGTAAKPGLSTPFGAVPAYLQVKSPSVQAYLDLDARFHAFAGAQVCVVACTGPALGPFDFDKSRELLAINRGGDGKVRLFGDTLSPDGRFSALDGLVRGQLTLPNLDGSSAAGPGGGISGLAVESVKRSSFATIGADLAGIAGKALGIPLSGNLGPFGYNLVQATAGLTFSLEQTVRFEPTLIGELDFTSDVTPYVNGVAQAPTSVITYTPGQNVTFAPGERGKLGVLPKLSVAGRVTSQLDLLIGGALDVRALGADIAGLRLGPLIDKSFADNGFLRVGLLDDKFNLDLGQVTSKPVRLDFNCSSDLRQGEFVIGRRLCSESDYELGAPTADPDGTYSNIYGAYNCGPRNVGRDGTPIGGIGFCSENPFVGVTSSYEPRFFGDIFLNDVDQTRFPSIGEVAGNASDRALVDAGRGAGGGSLPPFEFPAGAPLDSFQVPEPGTAWVVAGAVLTLAGWRSRRRSPGVGSADRR